MQATRFAAVALVALATTATSSAVSASGPHGSQCAHVNRMRGLHLQADRVVILAMQIESELKGDFRQAQGISRMLRSTDEIQRLAREIDRPVLGMRDWQNRNQDMQQMHLLASSLERDVGLLRPMRPPVRQNVMHRGRNGYVFGGGPLVVQGHDFVGPADIARLSRMVQTLQDAVCDLDSQVDQVRPVPYRVGSHSPWNGSYFGIQLGSFRLSTMGN